MRNNIFKLSIKEQAYENDLRKNRLVINKKITLKRGCLQTMLDGSTSFRQITKKTRRRRSIVGYTYRSINYIIYVDFFYYKIIKK